MILQKKSAPQPAHDPEQFPDVYRLRQMFIHPGVLCQCDVLLKCVR